MKTQIVYFRRDAGHLLLPAQALPGEQGDGSIICAIDDCPDALPPERLLVRLGDRFRHQA